MSLEGAIAKAIWGGGVDLSADFYSAYPLNEVSGTRADVHSGTYNLTEFGTVGSEVAPGRGRVAHFVGDTCLTGAVAAGNLGSGDWYSCCWARRNNDYVGSGFRLWGTGISTDIRIYPSVLIGTFFNGGGYVAANRFATYAPGRWYFIEVWRDGGTVYIDVDRSGSPTSVAVDIDYTADTSFKVGGFTDVSGTFDNSLSNLFFFVGTFLTETERDAIYNDGHGTSYISLTERTTLVGTPGTPSTEAERYAEAIWDYSVRTVTGGGEGATATLSVTIDNLTLAFTGYVDVEAGHNGVISDVTLSSNIQVSTQAALSQTLNNVTLQSTVVANVTANLNQTIDNLILVSNVVFDFEAVLDATIDSINLNSSLIVHPQASLNVTLDNLTLVSTITDASTPTRVYPIFGSSIFV